MGQFKIRYAAVYVEKALELTIRSKMSVGTFIVPILSAYYQRILESAYIAYGAIEVYHEM